MKTRFGILILAFLMIADVGKASELAQSLNVTLSAPSSPWINKADCTTPSDVKLAIAWSLQTTGVWNVAQGADVFIAASSTCDVVKYEIGDVRSSDDTGTDDTIAVGQTSGVYPSTTSKKSTLTFQDVLDSNKTSITTCADTLEEDAFLCIRWEYTYISTDYLGSVTTNYIYHGGAAIRLDTIAPGAPDLTKITQGDTNLKLTWTAPSDTDIESYNISYSVSGMNDWKTKNYTEATATSYQLSGLENNVDYDVKISAVDKAQNEGVASTLPVTGRPIHINDFFDTYKNDNGKEDGGFCFVATAAYGSYHDSMVTPLRQFRDNTLSQSSFGRGFIATYYQYGPRWARAIRDSAFHRTAARFVLLPVVAVAEAVNYLGLYVLLLLASAALIVAYGVRRSRRFRIPKSGAVSAVLLFFVVAASPIKAEAAEPQFQAQIRFGPYYPSVDKEAGLTGTPFKDIFGSRKRWLFEIDTDYEIWRGFGAVTIGGSFGYVQYVGKGLTDWGTKSADTAVLNLIPLRLTAGYAFDMMARWWNVPLVPYVGGGLSYYIWWSENGVGNVSTWSDANGKNFKARGGIFGFHVLGGIKFLLDVIDQDAAMNLENSVGIKNTYLFIEYQASFINNFGRSSSMDLSGNNIMFGMMMEF